MHFKFAVLFTDFVFLIMASASSSSKCESEWTISDRLISPTLERLTKYCSMHSKSITIDPVVTFSFPSKYGASDVPIHYSRLAAAGGQLAAMISPLSIVTLLFRENSTGTVAFSVDEDPVTFRIIRDYLYCIPINMDKVSRYHVFQTVLSARQWRLEDLFLVLCRYASLTFPIYVVDDIHRALLVAKLPNVPMFFKDYFWREVVRCYRRQCGHLKKDISFKLSEMSNVLFENVWELAIQHNMVPRFIHYLREGISNWVHKQGDILHFILHSLEPMMSDDAQLLELINEQMIYCSPRQLFNCEATPINASLRAWRLVVISLSEGWNKTYNVPIESSEWKAEIWPLETSYRAIQQMVIKNIHIRIYHGTAETNNLERLEFSAQAFTTAESTCQINKVEIRLFYSLTNCYCDGVKRVLSERCDVPVYNKEFTRKDQKANGTRNAHSCFTMLSNEINQHSKDCSCSAYFWCKVRITEEHNQTGLFLNSQHVQ